MDDNGRGRLAILYGAYSALTHLMKAAVFNSNTMGCPRWWRSNGRLHLTSNTFYSTHMFPSHYNSPSISGRAKKRSLGGGDAPFHEATGNFPRYPIPLDSIFFQDFSFVHVFRALLYGVVWTVDASLGQTYPTSPARTAVSFTPHWHSKTPIFNSEQMAVLSQSSQCLLR